MPVSQPISIGCGVEMLRVKRQHRDDDAEPHHIDEDGEEDDEEWRHGFGTGLVTRESWESKRDVHSAR